MEGAPPPCHECAKVELLPANMPAWEYWLRVNEFDRQYGAMGGVYKLSTQIISGICEIYNEGLETFEKILIIERLMYPSIVRGMENASKAKEDK